MDFFHISKIARFLDEKIELADLFKSDVGCDSDCPGFFYYSDLVFICGPTYLIVNTDFVICGVVFLELESKS